MCPSCKKMFWFSLLNSFTLFSLFFEFSGVPNPNQNDTLLLTLTINVQEPLYSCVSSYYSHKVITTHIHGTTINVHTTLFINSTSTIPQTKISKEKCSSYLCPSSKMMAWANIVLTKIYGIRLWFCQLYRILDNTPQRLLFLFLSQQWPYFDGNLYRFFARRHIAFEILILLSLALVKFSRKLVLFTRKLTFE